MAETDVRAHCRGVRPLTGRLTADQERLLGEPEMLAGLVAAHGSPLNLVDPAPLPGHARELVEAARSRGVELRVFFARKANKALALVDAARDHGHGVDVASDAELDQVLARGVSPERIVLTAAVKQRHLLERAVAAGVPVSLDGLDELALLGEVAAGRPTPVALRLAADRPVLSRFGLDAESWAQALASGLPDGLEVEGIHFHVHGYAAADRVHALATALGLVERARALGHPVAWVDIGGGVPMRYLDDAGQWDDFWQAHRRGLLDGAPLTWDGRGLGLGVVDGRLVGTPAVYPAAQEPVRGPWLEQLLDTRLGEGGPTAAEAVRAAGVRLHVEPGRSLLDGCGLTVARVEARKRRPDGTWLVSVAMNRTQCRSAADDFLVDPVLVPAGAGEPTPPMEGYLVGAYCIEAELLTWRRLVFPHGVRVGDLVVFVNTAGYQMHILESASHQLPLARNLVPDGAGGWTVDAIDRPVTPPA